MLFAGWCKCTGRAIALPPASVAAVELAATFATLVLQLSFYVKVFKRIGTKVQEDLLLSS